MKTLPANMILQTRDLHSKSAYLLLLDVTMPDGTTLYLVRNSTDQVVARSIYTDVAGHWKMNDDAADTVIADASGNGNNASLEGGDNTEDITITGVVNGALDFNGVDDYGDCGGPFESTFQGDFAIHLAIKPDDGQPSATEVLFSVQDKTGADSYVEVQLLTSGKLLFDYMAEGNRGNYAETNDVIFSDGAASEWTDITVTADANGKKIVVNGVEKTLDASNDGSVSGVTFAAFTSAQNPYIAARNGNGSDDLHFAGGVDNVILFGKTLTPAEVARLYDEGRGTEGIPITYTAANFDIKQSGSAGQGQIPTWTLEVENVTRLLEPYIQDQDGLVGATVKVTVVNSEYLGEDYVALEKTFEVLACSAGPMVVSFTLGAPNLLRQRFPLRRFAPKHCQWHFSWDGGECSYDPGSVAGVTLSGSDPVRVNIASHSIEDGEIVGLESVGGITPALAGEWTASYIDANNVDLDGTDSSDYTGTYSGGGRGGHGACPRTEKACGRRANRVRFGGHPGLVGGAIRLA